MSTMKPGRVLQMTITLAVLSTLAACGGGGDSPYQPIADPQTPTSPAPPPSPTTPTPPTTPPTTPPPPTDPAPQEDIRLAPGYTDINAAERLSQDHWPAWGRSGTTPYGSIGCAAGEQYHIHTMLSIYQNGVRLKVPTNIGITSCHYDLHTHDSTGVIHIETPLPRTFTLGQFFLLWGQPLSATGVAGLAGTPTFYVIENEKVTRVTTNPAEITLGAHKEIVIVTGTPPAEVPRWNWAATAL